MSQGWFNTLTSKPVQRSPEQLEADMAFTAMKAQLMEEQRRRVQQEAQERAAAAAAVSTRSCAAGLHQIDLSTARSPREEWNLLTTGRREGATY